MILGIDASNIRGGGGLTHLVEIMRNANPVDKGFSQVIIWSNKITLQNIEDREWIRKVDNLMLDKALPYRVVWQQIKLDNSILSNHVDLLFVPGGLYMGKFHPCVTMSQNLLPFDWKEVKRYWSSLQIIRLILLRKLQSKTFKKSDGVIFLSEYAKYKINNIVGPIRGIVKTIPHGIDTRFENMPRVQKDISHYNLTNTFKILYVSTVNLYKHQWHVVEAVNNLIKMDYPLSLDLIGGSTQTSLNKLLKVMKRSSDFENMIRYHGIVEYNRLHEWYRNADIFVFASSCENLPNILIEAMASGLPIACSNRGPMPEILGNSGVYFDPENPSEISKAIKKLIDDPVLRMNLAKSAFDKSKKYSWKQCANNTFDFLSEIYKNSKRK